MSTYVFHHFHLREDDAVVTFEHVPVTNADAILIKEAGTVEAHQLVFHHDHGPRADQRIAESMNALIDAAVAVRAQALIRINERKAAADAEELEAVHG